MNEAQTLSYTQAQTASRLHAYQILFLFNIIVNVLVGLWCIFGPVSFIHVVLHADAFPQAWPRVWGATLLGVQLLYIPGLRNPLFYRWLNWSSIAINFLLAIVFASSWSYFCLLAGWNFAAGVVLLIAYYRLLVADLRGNP
jgi:hypothetical protein